MIRLICFLILLTCLSAEAQLIKSQLQVLAPQNVLPNPGFEFGISGWTFIGSVTQISSGSHLADGNATAEWVPSTAGNTIQSTIPTPTFLQGVPGVGSCFIETAATDYTLDVINGSSVVIGTNPIPQSSSNFEIVTVFFFFPTSGNVSLRVTSHTSATIAYIDDCFLGTSAPGGIQMPTEFLPFITQNSFSGAFLGNISDYDQTVENLFIASTDTNIPGNNTNNVYITTGDNTASSSTGGTGNTALGTGNIISGTGTAGNINISPGNSDAGIGSSITENAGGSNQNTGGNINMSGGPGSEVSGNSNGGNIVLAGGVPGGSGSYGYIQFQNSNEACGLGCVWTEQDNLGDGQWEIFSPTFSAVVFRAGLSSNHSYGANTNIIYDTVAFDTASGYNNSTGNYTVPTTGYYEVIACAINASGTSNYYLIQNGSSDTNLLFRNSGTGICGSALVHDSSGDTLSIQMDATATVQGNVAETNFSIIQVH